jgi:hypothetical protein
LVSDIVSYGRSIGHRSFKIGLSYVRDAMTHENQIAVRPSTQQVEVEAGNAPLMRSNPRKEFLTLCREAKSLNRETHGLLGRLTRNILKLGQVLHRAKLAYEQMTQTGRGKRRPISGMRSFDEEIVSRTGISRAHPLRYCQIGKMSTSTATLIEGKKIASNVTALVRVAQAEGLASLPELAEAVDAFESGGRKEMDTVLDRTAPKTNRKKPDRETERPPLIVVPSAIVVRTTEVDPAQTTEVDPAQSSPDVGPSNATTGKTSTTAGASESPSVPTLAEVIEIPMVNGVGTETFLRTRVWVQIVPARNRKGGLAVRLSTKEPGSRSPESAGRAAPPAG